MSSDKEKEINNQNQGPLNLINSFFQQKPDTSLLNTLDQLFHVYHKRGNIPIKVLESETQFTIVAEMPGISKENIDVEILGNELRIRASTTNEGKEKALRQSVNLPQDISINKMKARYNDGLLEITFPKKKGKKIEIE